MENESKREQYGHVLNAAATDNKEIASLGCEQLEILAEKTLQYFRNISTDSFDWLRNPLIKAASNKS